MPFDVPVIAMQSRDDFLKVGGKTIRVCPDHKQLFVSIRALMPAASVEDVLVFTSFIGSIVFLSSFPVTWLIVACRDLFRRNP